MNTKTLLLIACGLVLVMLYACGDSEESTVPITERVKGVWVQTSFQTDCSDDELDEEIVFPCDEENCRRLILGDSTYTTINLVNGANTQIDEFYLFIVDPLGELVGSEIEICDGVAFDRSCTRTFEVDQSGDVMTLIRRSLDENCIDKFVYSREVVNDGGG
ncbi:MAG: hypothetical protein AAFO69_16780 [Bacteroidota bacterium]